MANSSLGKLTNKDSGKELKFSLNPMQFTLSRAYEYSVEGRIGRNSPVVAYKCGAPSQLSVELMFDKDADTDADLEAVLEFVKSLNKVDSDSKSVPLVEFVMGSFKFLGFTHNITFQPTRFDDQGNPTSAGVNVNLISSGEFEDESN